MEKEVCCTGGRPGACSGREHSQTGQIRLKRHLCADAVVAAGLEVGDALGVAVHGVAHPRDNLP